MRAAVLHEYGKAPVAGTFDDPPAAGDGQVVVEVEAAGLNPVDRSKASGSFYAGVPPLPCVWGGEGVGRTADGTRVYFDGPVAPYGSFAERALVAADSTMPVPDDIDPGLAVACGIAGLAAWLALGWRARLRPGDRVLVLGASGVVGQVAVQAAKLLGAERVVAAARSPEGLERAHALGADLTVSLTEEDGAALARSLREACGGEGPDVVVDPVWGPPASAALEACAPRARFVQLGQSAGAQAALASSAIRGKSLDVLGHTNFRAPQEAKREAYERMLRHAAAGELSVGVERWPLEEIDRAWERQAESAHHKLVIVP